ncbi:very short patch repair endonuclease [Bradyrhizobium ottawaense]|uniref:very short patch repair endonuclease n=1 Tax=Bradyrhizobium ottawaense TaxID=931866 RepID=UPI001BA75545|nr:very short patch repair endonuclease [Bradyrhizobium ottawaense]MBR1365041.1 DNA mismatch endonuclease Vsr [Bradyrhizobium ottawaense]
MDFVSKEKRSAIMRGVRGRDTKPEMLVRSLLHKNGYRFRLHARELPGKPDIVLPKYNLAIFVHGCFWHQHAYCADGRRPASNVEFWERKFTSNAARDKRNEAWLHQNGWQTLTIWECETREIRTLVETVRTRLPLRRFRSPTR